MQTKAKHIIFLSLFFITLSANSQDFVYTPKNPAFGGNYLNYSWMLSSAQAQNTITEQTSEIDSYFDDDPLADFEDRLNSQILSELSRRLIDSYFGEEGIEEGEFQIGGYTIDVSYAADGIQVHIVDETGQGTSDVIIPYF